MNKEEILKMSRAQKEDEGVVYTDNKGRRYGVIGFSTFFIIIVLFNLFNRQNNFVPFSMFWAYASAEAYGKYKTNKSKTLLITIVMAAIAATAFLACYVIEVMGIGA